MIISENTNIVITNVNEVLPLQISRENENFITSLLRDKIYSDKETAVIREYFCNAVDAHIEAGRENTPVSVHLPTPEEPYFSIRDFGNGLSHEEIDNRYRIYGESTKRHTNTQTGFAGLGCKVGYCLDTKFIIKSVHKNIENTYAAYIDSRERAVLSLLGSVSSNKPSGMEIYIPIQEFNIKIFNDKAQRYFTLIKAKCICNLPISHLNPIITGSTEDYTWELIKSVKSYLIMGNVPYPIQKHFISSLNKYELGYLIFVPIGSVEPTVSRENLEDKKKTQEYLVKINKSLDQSISKTINKELNKVSSLFEYLLLHTKFKQINSSIPLKWKNQLIYIPKARNVTWKLSQYNTPIELTEKTILLRRDKGSPIPAITYFRTKKDHQIFLVHSENIHPPFDELPWINTSEYVVKKSKKYTPIKGEYFLFKHYGNISKPSSWWKQIDKFPRDSYGIRINRFQPEHFGTSSNLKDHLVYLSNLNLIKDFPIIGYKTECSLPSLIELITEKEKEFLARPEVQLEKEFLPYSNPLLDKLVEELPSDSPFKKIYTKHATVSLLANTELALIKFLQKGDSCKQSFQSHLAFSYPSSILEVIGEKNIGLLKHYIQYVDSNGK